MKVIAAYLLAKLGGKENPSAEDLRKILQSVGAETDDGKIELFLSLIKDHDVAELVAVGREKLVDSSSSSSFGGGVAVSGSEGGGAAVVMAPTAMTRAAEEKKEIKEESDDEFIFDLFG